MSSVKEDVRAAIESCRIAMEGRAKKAALRNRIVQPVLWVVAAASGWFCMVHGTRTEVHKLIIGALVFLVCPVTLVLLGMWVDELKSRLGKIDALGRLTAVHDELEQKLDSGEFFSGEDSLVAYTRLLDEQERFLEAASAFRVDGHLDCLELYTTSWKVPVEHRVTLMLGMRDLRRFEQRLASAVSVARERYEESLRKL